MEKIEFKFSERNMIRLEKRGGKISLIADNHADDSDGDWVSMEISKSDAKRVGETLVEMAED